MTLRSSAITSGMRDQRAAARAGERVRLGQRAQDDQPGWLLTREPMQRGLVTQNST